MSKKKTHTKFVEESNFIHNNRYSYPDQYLSDREKISIICSIHGIFKQVPSSHLQGCGCPKCAIDSKSKKLKSSFEEFVKKANIKHDNKFLYFGEYKNANTKLQIKCSIHGIFSQTPGHHLNGAGCPNCAGNNKKDHNWFVKKANIKHNNKYKYIETYINIKTSIKIECLEHGIFMQDPDSHLKGSGCSKCVNLGKKTQEEFIKKANEIHNLKYNYIDKFVNYNNKVKIECPIHGIFIQKVGNHLIGKGCPTCSHIIFKKENSWLDYFNISKNNRQIKINIGNSFIKVDGFNSITNTIYEFYGDFWHGNPNKFKANDINPVNKKSFAELYKCTIDRENLIKNAGYNLISIWESDWEILNITS